MSLPTVINTFSFFPAMQPLLDLRKQASKSLLTSKEEMGITDGELKCNSKEAEGGGKGLMGREEQPMELKGELRRPKKGRKSQADLTEGC